MSANQDISTNNTNLMDIAAIRLRQDAIVKEFEHANSLTPEEYEKQGWVTTNKVQVLTNEYAELHAKLKILSS